MWHVQLIKLRRRLLACLLAVAQTTVYCLSAFDLLAIASQLMWCRCHSSCRIASIFRLQPASVQSLQFYLACFL